MRWWAIRLAISKQMSYGSSSRWREAREVMRMLASEKGQAMTEYIIVFCLAVIPLAAFITPLRIAIHNYLQGIYFIISLPLF